jgi:hypothetical protein
VGRFSFCRDLLVLDALEPLVDEFVDERFASQVRRLDGVNTLKDLAVDANVDCLGDGHGVELPLETTPFCTLPE